MVNLKKVLLILGVFAFCFGAASALCAAPIITNEEITTLTDTTAIITWRTTNEAANAKVYYGIISPATTFTSSESSLYHYATLSNLSPGQTYKYYVESTGTTGIVTGEENTFTTLTPPSGAYLFTFATISDPQVATDLANTTGARGRPYATSEAMLREAITYLKTYSPAFTIVKGDLVDDLTTDGANQATKVKTLLLNLTTTSTVYPLPGNHDKAEYTAGAWYTTLLKPIKTNASAEASPTTDSIYNYSFDYQSNHFIILDNLKNTGGTGHVDTAWLTGDLAANTGKNTYIFMHNVITEEGVTIPNEVLLEVIGGGATTVDWNKIDIDNRSAFLTILDTYKNNIAGVFMGHIHDNAKYNISTLPFPFVRTAATIQFPVGFNIYKVYSNGYMQSFYKVPYYTEIARDQITVEGTYSKSYWEQFSLSGLSARNFVYSLSSIAPQVAQVLPANSSSSIVTNENLRIIFTKAMSQETVQSAFSISPDVSGKTYSWDSTGTTLTVSHAAFAASTAYTVTIGTGAKDSSGTALASAYSFSFTTGASPLTTAPSATFDAFTNNVTNNVQPTFTGIATSDSSKVTKIECRIDSGTWYDATALDGTFNAATERFSYQPSTALARGPNTHKIEARCTDAAGNVNTTYASYDFYVISDRPEVSLKSNGANIYSGDTIDKTPSLEITVITDKTLSTLNLLIDKAATNLLPSVTHPSSNPYIYFVSYKPTLTDGTHSLEVLAIDAQSNRTTVEASYLSVQSAAGIAVQGTPLNYPNPFDPSTSSTSISYILSKASTTTIAIYNLAGGAIWKNTYASGAEGGRAGYNEITWNGKASDGSTVGNGIYIYLIMGDGKVLGRGKLGVFKP